jgi:hypothetical protein
MPEEQLPLTEEATEQSAQNTPQPEEDEKPAITKVVVHLPVYEVSALEKFLAEDIPGINQLKITDAASKAVVEKALVDLKHNKEEIEKLFDEDASTLWNAHRTLTAQKNRFWKPNDEVEKAQKKAILEFINAVKRAEQAKAAAEEQQRRAEEAERERIQREAEAAKAANLFDFDEEEQEQPRVFAPVVEIENFEPAVSLANQLSNSISGAAVAIGKGQFKPVIDLQLLVVAAVQKLFKNKFPLVEELKARRANGEISDEDATLFAYILADQKLINTMTKNKGEEISNLIPGVTAERGGQVRVGA